MSLSRMPTGGAANTTSPFEGFTTMIQTRVDELGAFVDRHSFLPIEWLLIVLPFVIGIIRVLSPIINQALTDTYQRLQRVVIRDITAVFVNGYMTNGVPTDRNALLQNAIFMYLQRHVWSRKPLSANAWRNKTAVVLLLDPFRSRIREFGNSPFSIEDDSSSDSDSDQDMAMNSVTRSKKFMDRLLLVKLPLGTWVKADEASGVEISFRRCVTKYGKMAASERTLSLMARGRDASRRIDQFAQKSLSYLLTQLPNLTKSDRFFFELQPSTEVSSDDRKSLLFKRYLLSDDKNMDTLFFPERNHMVKLIDDFAFRRGRFAVEGFPYKLGVLLHGPHGAGKTAFVKALAAYTGRHVVSVPLGLVETNQQLYDIFLTRNYTCVGESEGQRLKLEEVIFLFDDVDASSPLVCARQRRRTVYRRPDALLRSTGRLLPDLHDGTDPVNVVDFHPDETDTGVSAEQEDEVLEEHVVELTERAKTGFGSGFLGFGNGPSSGSLSAGVGTVSPSPAPALSSMGPEGKKSLLGMFESADKLDMSGLLNVLDGVVDTPGRIVVMVTNHPEHLDPALVRPGRMSSRLRLDYARFDTVAKMTGLHFGEREPPVLTTSEILDRLEECVLAEISRREAMAQAQRASTPGTKSRSGLAHNEAQAEALNNDDEDEEDEDTVENTISLTGQLDGNKTDTTKTDVDAGGLIRGTVQKAATVPVGMASARVPHRRLSDEQVQKLRDAIAVVEREAEEAAKTVPHPVGDEEGGEGAVTSAYRFKIAPSEIELLCAQTDSFTAFLAALQSLMRGELVL